MSKRDYEISRDLAAMDPPFYAIVMAAMRKADDTNMRKLAREWPGVYTELQQRYDAPGGYLPGETRPEQENVDG